MTWNFSGPDGGATYEFVTIDGEQYVRWRRIGDHGIYRQREPPPALRPGGPHRAW